jgi:hypothetical protein
MCYFLARLVKTSLYVHLPGWVLERVSVEQVGVVHSRRGFTSTIT